MPRGVYERDVGDRKNPNWRGGTTKHYLYDVYMEMIARCERPSHRRFADYGGRGISVCAEWRRDFWSFVRDVGDRPDAGAPKAPGQRSRWSIDRIDNDGNYEPGNVRWATQSEQSRNRRQQAPVARDERTGRWTRQNCLSE